MSLTWKDSLNRSIQGGGASVSKLAGIPAAEVLTKTAELNKKDGLIPAKDVRKRAALCDYYGTHIKLAATPASVMQGPGTIPQSVPDSVAAPSVPSGTKDMRDPVDTDPLGPHGEVATDENKAPGEGSGIKVSHIIRIYKLLKMAESEPGKVQNTENNPEAGRSDLPPEAALLSSNTKAQNVSPTQAESARRQETSQLLDEPQTPPDKDPLINQMTDQMGEEVKGAGWQPVSDTEAIKQMLLKTASQECTCDGAGTCASCRVKSALAKITDGSVNENGQEPDAATLAIRM